jgi:transcriptional regulator with XRE-family HTH domain
VEDHDDQATNKHPQALELAERLKSLREERRISLRELGRRSGVSVNALSLMERGVTSPSVATLYRLADALGLPISAVFGSPERKEHVVFRLASQRTALPLPAGTWEGLGGEEFVGRVQPFMLTLQAGGDSGTSAMLHTGHEFVLCLQGRLEYEVEGRRFALGPGDSLLFAARQRHTWRNPGPDPTQALILLAGFEEYEDPMGLHTT